jgi:hypothetical protein
VIQHSTELGINPFVKQVLKLACLIIPCFPFDVKNIHHQTLGKSMTTYRHPSSFTSRRGELKALFMHAN